MKLLFVIPTLGTGGAERVATILANTFIEKNQVSFFVLEQSNEQTYTIQPEIGIKKAEIEVKRGSKIRAVYSFVTSMAKQVVLLQREIKQYVPDVIISFLPKADMICYLAIRNEKPSYKWISSERNDPMSRNKFERMVLNHIYKRTNFLVCQTEKVAAYYKMNGVTTVKVIRNPIQHQKEIKMNKQNYFIAMGRLDEQKNFEMLIRAYSVAYREMKFREQLVILGSGPLKKRLEEVIQELDLNDKVVLAGRKNEVYEYLAKAQFFVMSSNYEGLPNAMLEAMDAGLPVISTDFFTGAAREFIDKENGFIVPVNDEHAMAEALKEMLSISEEKREIMGQASRHKVKDLDTGTIIKEWDKIIEECRA